MPRESGRFWKRGESQPYRDSKPGPSSPSIVTVLPTLSRFPVTCLQAYSVNSKTNETESLKCLIKVRGRNVSSKSVAPLPEF